MSLTRIHDELKPYLPTGLRLAVRRQIARAHSIGSHGGSVAASVEEPSLVNLYC